MSEALFFAAVRTRQGKLLCLSCAKTKKVWGGRDLFSAPQFCFVIFFKNNTVCFPGFHFITAEESMAQETAAAYLYTTYAESIHLLLYVCVSTICIGRLFFCNIVKTSWKEPASATWTGRLTT